MANNLGGYGPTNGQSVGGTGGNLNERPDNSTPGGSRGNAGNSSSGSSGASGKIDAYSGSWAGAGPLKVSIINDAVLEALNNNLPRYTIGAVSTPAYTVMRKAYDALPTSQQAAAQTQINQAIQRAKDSTPDKISHTRESGGRNGNTTTVTTDNPKKKKISEALPVASNDIQGALNKRKVTEAAMQQAAAAQMQQREVSRKTAVAAAAEAGSNIAVAAGEEALNNATSHAVALNQSAIAAAATLAARKQSSLSADAAAVTAEKSYNDMQSKIFGKIVSNGQYGTYIIRDGGGRNGTTSRRFVQSGVSVNQIKAAAQAATAAREIANKRYAERVAAEKTALDASAAAYEADSRVAAAQAALTAAKKTETDQIKDAVKFTADFYTEVTKKYGDEASQLAQDLANSLQGKKIKTVDDALEAFEQFNGGLNKKFSVQDRAAISQALASVDLSQAAENLARFSKGFNVISKGIDLVDTIKEITKAIDTDNWRPVFVKLETLAVGAGAGVLASVAFSFIVGMPLGILGFALVMAIVGALIDERFMERVNKLIGI